MRFTDVTLLLTSRVAKGLIALVAVVAVGTTGYMAIEGWSFLDAVYMTVTTVTTVGFREVRPLSTEGRLFTLFLLLFGVGVAFYILTAMVAAIIEGDLRHLFGERRIRLAIEHLRDHYIICGFGRVGEEIAREMQDRQVPFVVVDIEPASLEPARGAGMLVLAGDASEEKTLSDAHIDTCKALIAATDSDATNTYITLTAKGLRDDVFVVSRLRSAGLEAKLRQAGASRVVSPYAIGGRRLALAAMQPIITEFIDLFPVDSQGDRLLAEVAIDADSVLANRGLGEALDGLEDVVVLAVRDPEGRLIVGPPRSTVLSPGTVLMVIGKEAELSTIGARTR